MASSNSTLREDLNLPTSTGAGVSTLDHSPNNSAATSAQNPMGDTRSAPVPDLERAAAGGNSGFATSTATPSATSTTSSSTTANAPSSILPHERDVSTTADEHVDNIATGIAGVVLTAPLAAIEAISPQVSQQLSNLGTTLQGHASNISQSDTTKAYANQASGLAQQGMNQASGLAQQARDALFNVLPPSLGGTGGSTTSTTSTTSTSTAPNVGSTTATNPSGDDVLQNISSISSSAQQKLADALPPQLGGNEKGYSGSDSANPASTLGMGSAGSRDGISDVGRQSTTDQIGSATKPDSQKSMTEQAGDYLKGTADNAASYAQPNSEKSATQRARDALSNDASGSSGLGSDTGRQSLTDKASSSMKPDSQKTYTEQASDSLKGAADSVASYAQPSGQKSYMQSLSDNFNASNSSSGIGSDTGRQGLTDKMGSSMKPDSQKTYTEQASDYLRGTADNAASYMQPQDQKSASQKLSDAFGSNSSGGNNNTGI